MYMSWNDNFEALKGMATDVAQAAAKKTKQLAAEAKASLAIRAEEEKIKKAQIELGKLYYRDFVVGEEPDAAEYLPWCQRITESKETIEDLKSAVDDLKSDDAAAQEPDAAFGEEAAAQEAEEADAAQEDDCEDSDQTPELEL